ncbi:MAG: hypothetical protein V3U29_05620 [Phycisphaeraceae bacterium]
MDGSLLRAAAREPPAYSGKTLSGQRLVTSGCPSVAATVDFVKPRRAATSA